MLNDHKYIRYFMLLAITLIIFSAAVYAISDRDERKLISQCKRDCVSTKRIELRDCNSEYRVCISTCNTDRKSCNEHFRNELKICKDACNDSSCKRECLNSYRSGKKEFCSSKQCKTDCLSIKKPCLSYVKEEYTDCKNGCKYTVSEENITCENGKYQAGETFLLGCKECKCKYDSEIYCKKTKLCNFESTDIDEEYCTLNGGFYQELCKGPYFGIKCHGKNVCQCGGDFEYSCPLDYTCVKDFIPPNLAYFSTPGWKTKLGGELGDIGICARNPDLSTCGNNICENLVCLEAGCPEPESSINCPQDCEQ